MREMINILVAGMVLCGSAAFAGETRPLTAFDKLEVSQGVEIHIGCGSEAKAVLDGTAADLADMRVGVEGGTLKIRRGHDYNGGRRHDTVTVQLTATGPLTSIDANTGVEAFVESCAVSTDHVALSLSTGADMKVAGRTGRATIDANTGAKLQPPAGQRFDAADVTIDANTGADIKLCKVEHLSGRSALGSSITAESVGSNSIRNNLGASFSLASCR